MQKISLALVTALVILVAAPTRAQTPTPSIYTQQLEALNAAREVLSEMRQYAERNDYGTRSADKLIEQAEKVFRHLDQDLGVLPSVNLLIEYGELRIKVREKALNDAYETLVYYGLGHMTNETPEMVVDHLRDAIARAKKEGVNTVAKQMMIPYHLNRAYFEHARFLVERVVRTAEGLTRKDYYYSAHAQIHRAQAAIVAATKVGTDVDDLRIRLVKAQDQACSRDTSCQRPLTDFEQ